MKINERVYYVVGFLLFPPPLSIPHTSDISIRLLNIYEVKSIHFSGLTVQNMIFFSVNK